MTHYQLSILDKFLSFKNGKTSPSRGETGNFAVFGSNGEIGRSDYTNAQGPLVVIGRVGSYCGSLFYSEADAWVTDNAIVCSSKDSHDIRYWYYALQTLDLNGRSSGSGQPLLNQGVLNSIAFDPPAKADRQAIAEVLGVLDDKIAANSKLANSIAGLATLEFSRVYQCANEVVRLSELVSTQYGVTTSAHGSPGPKFLRVTDINKKPWIEWDTTPNCTVSDRELDKYRVLPGDILVARMADPGKAAFIDFEDPEAVFASYLVRLKPQDAAHALYLYYFLRSPQYLEYAQGAMTGSVQNNMNAKVIVATDIALPGSDLILQFNETVGPLRRLVQSQLNENRNLAATRDALLPQLMSGKLRVKDAEKALGNAGV